MDMHEALSADYLKVRGFKGIACYPAGVPKVWVPYMGIGEDEDGNEFECETDEGEFEDDYSGKLYVVMVGDDHKNLVDPDDCEPMAREAFCGECGQVGCTHDGYDRDTM